MGARTSNKPEKVKCNGSKSAVVLFLAAAAAFLITSEGSAEQGPGEVNVQGGWAYTAKSQHGAVQGGWAYTAKSQHGAVEHVATTRAAEDAVWFLLACRADGRLTVSFIHDEHFPFPLKPVSLVKLQSDNVPTAFIEAKSVENNRIFVAPLLMRHIMLLLMQDDEVVVSIPERGGAIHDYTFSMQPNDLALRSIRFCFDF
jgi:hypothetical protein